ncbi:MAG: hypothetical protein MUF13_02745 [Akkermansiaceae bacterium]|nr:hypothetical protein [Akkermansiaceae bacterium]
MIHQIGNDTVRLKDDMQALLQATAHIADEHVVEARKKLNDSLSEADEMLDRRLRQTRQFVKKHSCETAMIAAAAGAVLAWLFFRRDH